MSSNRLNNTSDYELFTNSLSTLINKILGLDREENIEILELNGRVVQVVLTQIDLKFHIVIDNNQFAIKHGQASDPDVTVSGTALNYLTFFESKFRRRPLAAGSVQISGDLGVAKQVENLIEKIDFDGEELLSKIVGDASAHVVFYNLGTIRNKLLATVGKAKFDLIDYIQYEKTLVPSSGDFKNFVDQMSSLSKRLESVEHQMKTIEKTGRRAI